MNLDSRDGNYHKIDLQYFSKYIFYYTASTTAPHTPMCRSADRNNAPMSVLRDNGHQSCESVECCI